MCSMTAGNFLYNNYRQAINIIDKFTPDVEKLKLKLKISDSDLLYWLEDETTFLRKLREEAKEHTLESAYVEALAKCEDL